MQIPILSGIYASETPDLRIAYPRNLRPVPRESGLSKGYLRPIDGIVAMPNAGPGIGRGGINWNGTLYRVMGTKLVSVAADGEIITLGDVGIGPQVSFDYSFDSLGVAASGRLYYWDGAAMTQVGDPDLGYVRDVVWIAGYWLTTDGTSLVVTELTDPTAVNPLKYGSSESDPDPVMAVDKLRNEAYALNRYSIEAFRNIGGNFFPFQRIDGAHVAKGVIGTHAYCKFLDSFAFVGSGRNEAPAVYVMVPGGTEKLSTDEIDKILASYDEYELSQSVVEAKVQNDTTELHIHLPDQCLVFDSATSKSVGEKVWFTQTTSLVGNATYRGRNLVWCYDRWNCEDPLSAALGRLDDTISSHYGEVNGWEFGSLAVYNGGNSGIVHELELVSLTGRVALGSEPVVWTSYSHDGETWSQERSTRVGAQGDRLRRVVWRSQGQIRHWRVQRFRGTSEAHIAPVRLEATMEALNA